MHSQLIFKMRTCHFVIVKKESPLRVLCEIDLLRHHNNKSHVLWRDIASQLKGSDSSMKVRIKCINAVSNKSE